MKKQSGETVMAVLVEYIRLIGMLSIFVSAVTWGMDLMGLVHACPYCRVQRTAIGLIGILMAMPQIAPFLWKYLAVVIGAFGADVSGAQLLIIAKEIFAGKAFGMINLALSSLALFIIVGQIFILFAYHQQYRQRIRQGSAKKQ